MGAGAMTRGLLLVAVMALVPTAAFAQPEAFAESEGVGEEVSAEGAAMRPVTAGAGDALRPDTSLTSVHLPRLVLASLGGAALGAGLGTAGFYAAGLAMCAGSNDLACALGALVLGGGLGATVGVLGGTMLVGGWMDGDGAWWGVLGGMAVGVGLGITASNFLPSEHAGTLFGATMVGTVLLGALGYELTSHHSAKRFRQNRLALAPSLLPGGRGTMGAGLVLSGAWN